MRKQRPREGLEAKPVTLLALVLAENTQHSIAVACTQRVRHTNGEILQRTDFIVLTSSSDLAARTYRGWLLTSAGDSKLGDIKMKIPKSGLPMK